MSSNRRVLAAAIVAAASALAATSGVLAGSASAITPQPTASASPSPDQTATPTPTHSESSPSPSPSATSSSTATPRPAASPHRRKAPKGCGKIKIKGTGIASCAYITGFSDVRKFNEAALLQPKPPKKPGLLNVDFAYKTKDVKVRKGVNIIAFSTARLYYHGRPELPPVRATFLGFRFVPVTATLRITELTPIKIRSVSQGYPPFGIRVVSRTTVSIRLSGARVNGQPLNVGQRCRTAAPVPLKLIGTGKLVPRPHGYTIPTGGPLSGTVAIPRFTGCGTSENLNPLFTGSVSGPGNFTIMTQGKLCMPFLPRSASVCPPRVPRPRRRA
jgi:hypothetical protein